MVYGIGTDMCDLRRIQASLARRGERFAQRVLMAAEFAQWQERSVHAHARGLRYLASRFSAKEAFSKAIGLGLRLPMGWQYCEVRNLPSGQPQIVVHGALRDWFEARNLSAHLSLSDESNYALSFCVVEQQVALPVSVSVPVSS